MSSEVSGQGQGAAIYTVKEIRSAALEHGLVLRGGFGVDAEDRLADVGNQAARALLLFGNAGPSIWSAFTASREYGDGRTDPLNRWSERIGNRLAADWGGKALFPFGGPPYEPFLSWAKKAEGLSSSQLGLLMHPRYGLWHAYRFAVALPYRPAGLTSPVAEPHACDSCLGKPCLSGCPVDAFTAEGYDVEVCFRYLRQHPDAACHQSGCQARVACPEGQAFRYVPEQAAFHMKQFLLSLDNRFDESDRPTP